MQKREKIYYLLLWMIIQRKSFSPKENEDKMNNYLLWYDNYREKVFLKNIMRIKWRIKGKKVLTRWKIYGTLVLDKKGKKRRLKKNEKTIVCSGNHSVMDNGSKTWTDRTLPTKPKYDNQNCYTECESDNWRYFYQRIYKGRQGFYRQWGNQQHCTAGKCNDYFW